MRNIAIVLILLCIALLCISAKNGCLSSIDDSGSGSSAPESPLKLTSDAPSKSVKNNETVTYHVTIHNDSGFTRPIKVTGTPAAGNWVITYYDLITGTDITGNMTGPEGFSTPAVTPTGSYTVQLEVTPVSVTAGSFLDTIINSSFTDNLQIKDEINIRTTGLLKPVLFSSYDTPLSSTDLSVLGNYAYIGDEDSLDIVDISNPASPTFRGSYAVAGRLACVSGNYAYVIVWSSGLKIIDVSNPNAPTLAGSYDTTNYITDVYVSGNYAYITNYASGLEIFNISNPATPVLSGSYNIPYADSVYVSGNYAYVVVATGASAVKIIDVSNPAASALVGSYNGLFSGIDVSGNYAYLTEGYEGLKIVNVSNPAAPVLVGAYIPPALPSGPSQINGVFVSGNYAYVRELTSTLIINISNPSQPTLAGSWSPCWDLSAAGNYAYTLTWGSDWVSDIVLNYDGTTMDPDWGSSWNPGLQIIRLTE